MRILLVVYNHSLRDKPSKNAAKATDGEEDKRATIAVFLKDF